MYYTILAIDFQVKTQKTSEFATFCTDFRRVASQFKFQVFLYAFVLILLAWHYQS